MCKNGYVISLLCFIICLIYSNLFFYGFDKLNRCPLRYDDFLRNPYQTIET